MKRLLRTILAVITLFAVIDAAAEPNGYPGRTSTSSAGCGDCHGNNPTSATTLSLQGVVGVVSMTLGEKRQFTIVVAHPTQKASGFGVAVRTSQTGTTNVGTLSVQSGTGVRLRGSEVTHSSPKTMSGGSASFTFSWTAPQTPGTYYMQAIGNAVNGNGKDDGSDTWNWMVPVEIVVSTTSSVDDIVAINPTMKLWPSPWTGNAPLELHDLPTDATDVSVLSLDGAIVYQQHLNKNQPTTPLPIPTVPSGTYMVIVETPIGFRGLPLIVIR